MTCPVRSILDAQAPADCWDKPGAGYARRYTGTVWSMVFLSMFGADGRDPAVRRGCAYVLDHSRARTPCGRFSALMELYPTGMMQCLCGKMWQDVEQKGQPSEWVTLRVLRVPKQAA